MVIQKINSKYVGNDCIQIMLPYVNHDFMVLDNQGVIYVDSKGRHENHYLEDERRHNFPYSNRPIHKDKKYGVKLTFVNQ